MKRKIHTYIGTTQHYYVLLIYLYHFYHSHYYYKMQIEDLFTTKQHHIGILQQAHR